MTDSEVLQELRAAREAHDRHRNAVQDEMGVNGAQGILWQNSYCAAWPNYVEALAVMQSMREKYRV
jgi:hypothetical protein